MACHCTCAHDLSVVVTGRTMAHTQLSQSGENTYSAVTPLGSCLPIRGPDQGCGMLLMSHSCLHFLINSSNIFCLIRATAKIVHGMS